MHVGCPCCHRIRGKISAFSLVALVSLVAACASAESPDYRFEVADQPVAVGAHSEFDVRLTEVSTGQPVAVGAHSEFDVRLTEVSTGQPVSNAMISTSALEMTHYRPPTGKGTPPGGVRVPMTGEVKFLGPAGPGLYRFMGDVSMPGTWTRMSAHVPGESEPIEGTATFEAGR